MINSLGEVPSSPNPHIETTMKKIINNRIVLTKILITMFIILGFSGCQSDQPELPPIDPSNQSSEITTDEQSVSEGDSGKAETSAGNQSEKMATDPNLISSQWEESAHAAAYVIDSEGKNNACARCHAPIQWAPTMADLPESCFTCKFELSEPPATIAETEWQSIPCKVCHQLDKKGNVQPEVSWLEVAALDEYVSVENTNELCLKCHEPANLREHIAIEIGGAHGEFLCTDCHNSHALATFCGDSSCHESLQEPDKIIVGHDEDHVNISCEACHDASGLDVGIDEITSMWVTYAPWSVESEEGLESGTKPFVSHNTILEVNCERCHFLDNPWDLSVDIQKP